MSTPKDNSSPEIASSAVGSAVADSVAASVANSGAANSGDTNSGAANSGVSDSTVIGPIVTASDRLQLSAFFVDTAQMTKRNVKRLIRTPQLLIFATIQPVMFVLLFRYVFGESIQIPGWRYGYADYLIPGIMIQTVAFGSSAAAIGMAADMSSGLVDRFKSLPMSRLAVLAGRTFADSLRHTFVVTLMVVVGSIVGFRFHNGFGNAVVALGLAVLFGYSLAWLFAYIGMAVKEPETAQLAGFVPVFPLVFLSGAFSPINSLPPVLEAFARNQPLGHAVSAIRGLTQGIELNGATSHHVIMCLVWSTAIIVTFGVLSTRKYARA